MGVRFACQACGKRLHVKAELAGKRGICPKCGERFRIPQSDQEWSIRLGSPEDPGGSAQASAQASAQTSASRPQASFLTGNASSTGPPLGLLDSETEAIWYVRPPSGGQYGPARSPLLRQWVKEHRVAADALVWRDGWPQWREAIDVFPEYATELSGAETADEVSRAETGTAETGAAETDIAETGIGELRPGGRAGEGAVGEEIRPIDPRRPSQEGGVWLGARRLARRNRRVWAIVVLVLISLLLIVALIIVSTRPPAATTAGPYRSVPGPAEDVGPRGLFGGRWVAGWSSSG